MAAVEDLHLFSGLLIPCRGDAIVDRESRDVVGVVRG